jgi:capsular exopolysaccharide synthesis family protein
MDGQMSTSPKPDTATLSATSDREVDIANLIATIWRGKLIVAGVACLALLAGFVYAYFLAVPVYTAHATIALESRQEQIVDIESVVTGLSSEQSSLNTEVEVLRSRGLIGDLVDDLNLTEDPEFNPALTPAPRISLSRLVALIRPDTGVAPDPDAIRDDVVDNVIEAISVSNVRQTFVFRISVVTRDRRKSAQMANRLAELYIDDQVDVKFQRTEKATEWLSDRVSELRIQLEEAETALKSFSTGTDLISPEGLFAMNRQIKELRDRRSGLEETLASSEAAAARLGANSGAEFEIRAREAEDTLLVNLLPDASAGDPRAQDRFNDRYEDLRLRAQQEAIRAKQQLAVLDRSIKELDARIERQSTELVRLQQYQREAEANRLIYEHFLGRLKEMSVQEGIQQADSRVLSHAVVPSGPSAPRKTVIMAMALVLGTFGGAGLVLLREAAQNTFRAPEALEKMAGIAVIGQIPLIASRRRKNVLKYLAEKPNSAAAEAVRNLRTSILLADIDNPPKVIMSTSSIPGEGKTTQSLAMAQNLAGLGKNVLLIEGDIRKRVFREYFELDTDKGLIAVLSGEVPLSLAVRHVEALNCDVLIGEPSHVNAADLFSSERFQAFLNDCRQHYDYVVVDTPPVLPVPDARVIGQFVDAIMYAVRWDHTTRRQVAEGLRSLANVGVKVSGLVLTQIDGKGMKRYGYGDYKAYDSYYSE